MAELKIKVQTDGDVRAGGALMTDANDIADSMVRNWTALDYQKANPVLYGPEHFPYTPEQERMAEQAFAAAFPQDKYPVPHGRDIGDYVFIGNRSLSEMYAQHQEAYEKLFPSKKSFMEMAVYAEALKRENAISFVNPLAIEDNTRLHHDAIMTVQPEVTDVARRGFFGAIWNRVRNFLGLAGSETAINNEYKTVHKRTQASQREVDIANKFSIDNITKSDVLQNQMEQEQAKRDAIQQSYIKQMLQFSPHRMHKDFFGDMTNDDFKKDTSSLGSRLHRGTRMNVLRMYMLSKGYSMDDIFSPSEEMAEARREVGKEFMERLGTGDLNVHADMCAEMFKTFLNEDIYPRMDLTDDASIVKGYTAFRTIEFSISLWSELSTHSELMNAVNERLTPEEHAGIQAKTDSLILLCAPISDRIRLIRCNEYSNVNEDLKDATYRQESSTPVEPDTYRLRGADRLLGEYQKRLETGLNISQIITDRAAEGRHQSDVIQQAEQELLSMPPAEREKIKLELRSPKRDIAPSHERRDVTNEFTGSRQPQKLTENQKARQSPQKERSIQPM